jgi:beta-glucosidase/6-phospho-beta-glucosidase/beta-galactosidase
VHVNYETLERTLKSSGRWYAEVCAAGAMAE